MLILFATVAEDYSSFEDADPNEPDGNDSDAKTETDYGDDIDVDVSGKTVPTKAAKSKPQAEVAKSSAKRQPQPSGGAKKTKQISAAKPGQQKLASFFGKK
jgi:hypothetical protein